MTILSESKNVTGLALQGSGGVPNNHTGWRESKWLAIAELAIVVLIFVADARHLIPFSKTPFLLLFGWISLKVRKIGWRRIVCTDRAD